MSEAVASGSLREIAWSESLMDYSFNELGNNILSSSHIIDASTIGQKAEVLSINLANG
jgi:hypothetical protein